VEADIDVSINETGELPVNTRDMNTSAAVEPVVEKVEKINKKVVEPVLNSVEEVVPTSVVSPVVSDIQEVPKHIDTALQPILRGLGGLGL
jgi:hypothetical protein